MAGEYVQINLASDVTLPPLVSSVRAMTSGQIRFSRPGNDAEIITRTVVAFETVEGIGKVIASGTTATLAYIAAPQPLPRAV